MISNKKITENLALHDNNRQSCNNCGENIPAKIKRLSWSYKTKFGINYYRLCERCIHILSKECNKKNVAAWEKELEQKTLIKGLKE